MGFRARARLAGRGPRAQGVVAALVVALAVVGLGAPAEAGPTIPRMPQTDASDVMPRVVDDTTVTEAGVRELRQVGTRMYAGGEFRTVLNRDRTRSFLRRNLFSFNAATGTVSSWAPVTNGGVYALEPSADGQFLYIGGDFTTFDGRTVRRLVKYDLVNNRVDTSFTSAIAATRVSDLQLVGGRLLVSGTFPGGIAALDPNTGARTTYLDGVQATGQKTGYTTRIYRFAVNPTATQMVVIGSFTSIGGQARQQAALVNLGASSATVSAWSSPRWNEDCPAASLQWYTRDVDWSPDGSGFAIVTTGAGAPNTTKLCDTASYWRPVQAANQQPVWINYSGGDTFHSVLVTDRAVFVGGHIRWLDNPLGRDTAGPGAVNRLGIGAIDPVSGRALPWNPSKSVEGGLGAFDLYVTSQGLWVGHYERFLGTGPNGRELHEGLGLLPF